MPVARKNDAAQPTKPSGPGRPKDLAKRAAILEAAKRMFTQHGLDGASMDQIAAEAGVSKLTVYSHFGDKETLFAAAVRAYCEQQLPNVLFDSAPCVNLRERLMTIAEAFYTMIKWIVLENISYGETIYVASFWNWVLAFNPGAAFSFLADQPGWQRWLFTVLALGVSGWIAFMLRQHPQQKLLSLALALVMGGALGNVIDRVRFGAVVDFVQWHVAGYYWPAFNVADSAITIGAVLLVIEQLTTNNKKENSR